MRLHDLDKAEDRGLLLLDLLKSDDHRLHAGLMYMAELSDVTGKFSGDLEALGLAQAWAQVLIRWIAGDAAGQPETMVDRTFVNAILSVAPSIKEKP